MGIAIEIVDGNLHITMKGFDKILAVKSSLTIPLVHIQSIQIRPEEVYHIWHGLKIGTNFPGGITAGTFFQTDGQVFMEYRHEDRTVGITLTHETYKALYLEVPENQTPEEFANMLLNAARSAQAQQAQAQLQAQALAQQTTKS